MKPLENDEVRVSSSLVFDQVRLMRELYGAETVARAQAGLPAALRDELSALIPGGWITLDAAREMKNAVAAMVGIESIAFQRLVCKKAVERTLTTLWRLLLRQLGDETISKRAPMLYSRTFNRGSLEFVGWRDGGAQLELRSWPDIPDYDLAGLMAGAQAVFELSGRKDVQVMPARRPPLVILHVKWRR